MRVYDMEVAKEFFAKAKHPYSELLLESMPAMEVPGTRPPHTAPGEIPSAAAPPVGCAFHPRCPHAQTRCREEVPELRLCGPSSKVACFLYT